MDGLRAGSAPRDLVRVLPALRGVIPGGGLRPGAVVGVEGEGAGSLGAALVAGVMSEDEGWCAIVGVPEFGVSAAIGMGASAERLLLVEFTCVRVSVEVGFADGHVLRRLWRHDGALSSVALAERVRWQLSAWQGDDAAVWGGVTWLELAPDQLVPDVGRQESLWGQSAVSERVARAVERIQTLLGHRAITRPVPTGGLGPAEQIAKVPVGDVLPEGLPDGPWPGRVPAPAPGAVPPRPLDAEVRSAEGAPVVVSSRCAVSAPPARLAVAGGREVGVTSWTGPWPATERWWDPAHARRRARFQVVTEEGRAYLLAVEGGDWHVEASYD